MKHIIESTDLFIIDGWNDDNNIFIGTAEMGDTDTSKIYPVACIWCDSKGYSETTRVTGKMALTEDNADWGGLVTYAVPTLPNELVAVKIIFGVIE